MKQKFRHIRPAFAIALCALTVPVLTTPPAFSYNQNDSLTTQHGDDLGAGPTVDSLTLTPSEAEAEAGDTVNMTIKGEASVPYPLSGSARYGKSDATAILVSIQLDPNLTAQVPGKDEADRFKWDDGQTREIYEIVVDEEQNIISYEFAAAPRTSDLGPNPGFTLDLPVTVKDIKEEADLGIGVAAEVDILPTLDWHYEGFSMPEFGEGCYRDAVGELHFDNPGRYGTWLADLWLGADNPYYQLNGDPRLTVTGPNGEDLTDKVFPSQQYPVSEFNPTDKPSTYTGTDGRDFHNYNWLRRWKWDLNIQDNKFGGGDVWIPEGSTIKVEQNVYSADCTFDPYNRDFGVKVESRNAPLFEQAQARAVIHAKPKPEEPTTPTSPTSPEESTTPEVPPVVPPESSTTSTEPSTTTTSPSEPTPTTTPTSPETSTTTSTTTSATTPTEPSTSTTTSTTSSKQTTTTTTTPTSPETSTSTTTTTPTKPSSSTTTTSPSEPTPTTTPTSPETSSTTTTSTTTKPSTSTTTSTTSSKQTTTTTTKPSTTTTSPSEPTPTTTPTSPETSTTTSTTTKPSTSTTTSTTSSKQTTTTTTPTKPSSSTTTKTTTSTTTPTTTTTTSSSSSTTKSSTTTTTVTPVKPPKGDNPKGDNPKGDNPKGDNPGGGSPSNGGGGSTETTTPASSGSTGGSGSGSSSSTGGSTSGGGLASTGARVLPIAGLGLLILLSGIAVLLTNRRNTAN